MAARHHRLIRLVEGALVILAILAWFAWPFVMIQLRLSRNGAIARQLAEALHTQFPEVEFRGVAAYNREVVYITVVGDLDEARRRDVEQCLRRLKAEQNIAPTVELRFSHRADDEDIIRIGKEVEEAIPFLLVPTPRRGRVSSGTRSIRTCGPTPSVGPRSPFPTGPDEPFAAAVP
jgi:hypothetical protein